jgi:hypothetical protein
MLSAPGFWCCFSYGALPQECRRYNRLESLRYFWGRCRGETGMVFVVANSSSVSPDVGAEKSRLKQCDAEKRRYRQLGKAALRAFGLRKEHIRA